MDLMKLKALLGIPEGDTTQNIALQFLMEDVDETIRNYCNLKAVPAGLTSTSYRMAIDLYRYERPGDGEAPAGFIHIGRGHIHQLYKCGGCLIRRYPEGLPGAT